MASLPKVSRQMSDSDRALLKTWLTEKKINPRKIHREAADAVIIARMIAVIHPNMVEMHNYPARNNSTMKMGNWETLNKRVLKRLGIRQKQETLEKLAASVPGEIDFILHEIRLMEEEKTRRDNEGRIEKLSETREIVWDKGRETGTLVFKDELDDEGKPIKKKVIIYEKYKEVLDQMSTKEAEIKKMQDRVNSLQHHITLFKNVYKELPMNELSLYAKIHMNEPDDDDDDEEEQPQAAAV